MPTHANMLNATGRKPNASSIFGDLKIADVGLGNLAIAIPGPDPVQYNG